MRNNLLFLKLLVTAHTVDYAGITTLITNQFFKILVIFVELPAFCLQLLN